MSAWILIMIRLSPGIEWYALSEWAPVRWDWLGGWLLDECVEPLFSGGKASVLRLIKLNIRSNLL